MSYFFETPLGAVSINQEVILVILGVVIFFIIFFFFKAHFKRKMAI